MPALESRSAVYFHCPRCGLSIEPRSAWLSIEYCPRCLARARIPVRMCTSPLRAEDLYHEQTRPCAVGSSSGRERGSRTR